MAAEAARYNLAHDLLQRNLCAGRGAKTAYIDDTAACSFAQLAQRVETMAAALRTRGLQPEQRVLLCLFDTIDFPVAFLGCIWAGLVPVPVNTLLKAADYAYMLEHSRACALMVSAGCWGAFAEIVDAAPALRHVFVSGAPLPPLATGAVPVVPLEGLMQEPASLPVYPSCADDIAFWLYSSGSTGRPKGTVHLHKSPAVTARHYAQGILGLDENDVVFSAAKLFFAYGLGNALTHPLYVGATTLLMAERPTPDSVFRRWAAGRPTMFAGVPTLYASMLAAAGAELTLPPLRLCISAGEALPSEIGLHWRRRFGVDIVDGLGSTEMLHIFLSNRPGNVHYGTTGLPVPGYEIRLLGESGEAVAPGELGELAVRGESAAIMYWADRERSLKTFQGEWLRSGDKYWINAEGHYVYGGRSDDMLKVSGIYVSPFEIESVLVQHASVLEAAVVGAEDESGLIKPKAYVVLKPTHAGGSTLSQELQALTKAQLAPYKYPRWVEFVAELPKTATGKVQRFRLRALSSACTPLPPQGFLALADAQLEYRVINDLGVPAKQPWLVFLHEGLGSIALWKDFPERLCAESGCRGLVYSRRGYGASSSVAGTRGVDFMHREALDVLPEVLKAFGIQRCSFFTHSDGASIALIHAAAHRESIASIVALAPHLFVEPVTVESIEALRQAYLNGDLRERLARYHRDPDAAFWPWCSIWLSPEFRSWNIEDDISRIQAQLLLIQGEDDAYGSMAHIESIARQLPSTEILRLPDCGHSAYRDQPDAVIGATLAFLRRIAAAA